MSERSARTIDVDELRALATERIRRRRTFVAHVVAYVVGGVTLGIVWAATSSESPWIVYPLLAGAMALGVHAWIVFGRRR
jgi:2TM domain